MQKPLIYGSIYAFEGQVSVFNYRGGWKRPNNCKSITVDERRVARQQHQDWIYDETLPGPNYRDLYPEPPPPELSPNCSDVGVLGVLPGVIGSIQATETIKIVLGIGKSLSGRILCYNALDMSFREFKLQRDPKRNPIQKLIDYEHFCRGHEPFERLTVTNIQNMRRSGWNPFVLDVRTQEESTNNRLSFSDWASNSR